MTELTVRLKDNEYKVTVGAGLISRAGEFFNLKRRVFILTDSGVPAEYAEKLAKCADNARIYTVPEGEGSKRIELMNNVLSEMLTFGLTRRRCR